MKKKQHELARTLVLMNTGTRIHKAKKGKGAYKRANKIKQQPE